MLLNLSIHTPLFRGEEKDETRRYIKYVTVLFFGFAYLFLYKLYRIS
ncbi:hypothetical protein B4064_0258 [Caldibacillus thermoamylovorans]|uniref:Putative membrane protein n=1 Tax=Caldibacillus thermoamylovorans TaxID=35841 RepID=A0A090IVP1_9BACI|nr:hypothetical protein B4166_0851 [Caldibacillus thermoamylovorans]KIO62784.1 hypothetical protein B4064_0258 [Caldibacillus thermoamylovorans]KIO65815.1 hypothetical protein B4065_2428 [Caldibacillus thermoamylovorans]KIO70194.1 hypothetical protein B4167_0886 [Caldibacillus thermoamylovorans]CEE02161.1 putative membrane protein [Caldibacillus thermoamylovorans]